MTDGTLALDPAPVETADATPAQPVPTTPPPLGEGLYFGLDEARYHADVALGSGSIRELAMCPIYYWVDSWMNPLRTERAETDALLYGRALHCLVLEGPAAFQARYAPIPDAEAHPDAYTTMDGIKAALKDAGAKVSGSKAEISARLKEVDPTATFLDEIVEAFHADCQERGVTALKAELYSELIQVASFILGDTRVRAAFQGGRPEVSLFWEQDGVRMKARLDYVRLGKRDRKPIGVVTDLKSFSNVLDMPPERAVIRAIANTRLDVQAAAYFEGIKRIPEFVKSGKVFGAEGINPDWITALGSVEPADWQWYWCFYEKGSPISLLRSTHMESPLLAAARMDLARALDAYRDNMAAFGTQWRFVDPMADINVSLEDMPKWLAATA